MIVIMKIPELLRHEVHDRQTQRDAGAFEDSHGITPAFPGDQPPGDDVEFLKFDLDHRRRAAHGEPGGARLISEDLLVIVVILRIQFIIDAENGLCFLKASRGRVALCPCRLVIVDQLVLRGNAVRIVRGLVLGKGLLVFLAQLLLVGQRHANERIAREHVHQLRRHLHIAADAVVAADAAGACLGPFIAAAVIVILRGIGLQEIFDHGRLLRALPVDIDRALQRRRAEAEGVVLKGKHHLAPDLVRGSVHGVHKDLVGGGQILEGGGSVLDSALIGFQIEAFHLEVILVVLRPGAAGAQAEAAGLRPVVADGDNRRKLLCVLLADVL